MLSAFRDKLFSTLERHSRTGLEPFGFGTRVSVLVLMIVFVAIGAIGFAALVSPNQFIDPNGLDISGKWQFYNGSIKAKAIEIEVPKPLAPQINGELESEFFYKKKVIISESLRNGDDLNVTLGSIKGRYTIWINGQHLATSAAPLELANYTIPKFLLNQSDLEILVRVEKSETRFPGIVHFVPMQIGRTKFISHQVGHRFFQNAIKPIVPALFKSVIFLIFATLFFSMAMRREYFWFSLYALLSSLQSLSYWQYSPFFENFYLRQKVIFLFYVSAIACLPLLTAEFCRLGQRVRFYAAILSAFAAAMPALSLLWINSREGELYLYEKVYAWAPTGVFPVCIFFTFTAAWWLGHQKNLKHRMLQLYTFGIFLVVGYLLQTSGGQKMFQFKHFLFDDMIDVFVFVGLSISMVFDFKATSMQWQRSQRSLPSVVARLASVGLARAVVEFNAVVLVVDVVGYTKKLIALSGPERDDFNSQIKKISSEAVHNTGGEKISDTGDGAVFIWTYQNELEKNNAEGNAIRAAKKLAGQEEILFRCGISRGTVKCHWEQPEFSFLGDPINTAARLQSAAKLGGVLIDEKIEMFGNISEYEIKGARFRARSLDQKDPAA